MAEKDGAEKAGRAMRPKGLAEAPRRGALCLVYFQGCIFRPPVRRVPERIAGRGCVIDLEETVDGS